MEGHPLCWSPSKKTETGKSSQPVLFRCGRVRKGPLIAERISAGMLRNVCAVEGYFLPLAASFHENTRNLMSPAHVLAFLRETRRQVAGSSLPQHKRFL